MHSLKIQERRLALRQAKLDSANRKEGVSYSQTVKGSTDQADAIPQAMLKQIHQAVEASIKQLLPSIFHLSMANKTSHKDFCMKIVTWNAAGIKSKEEELQVFLDSHDIDIIMVGKTFLKPKDSFYLQGFCCFRRDRPARVGGRVAIFFRSYINAFRIDYDTAIEAVGMQTTLNGQPRTFIAVYRPPSIQFSSTDFFIR